MTTHRVYVVTWPGLVKVGVTNGRRWRTFTSRGATLHRLLTFTNGAAAYEYEERAHRYLSTVAYPAFIHRAQAVALLGNNGAGWMETYRLPSTDLLKHLPDPPDDVTEEPMNDCTIGTCVPHSCHARRNA
jgi:hypothetical protein